MQQLYKNFAVLDAQNVEASLCDVLIEDSVIKKIVPANTITGADNIIDGHGDKALLPGFVNAHGHASMVLLRGLGEELPLMDWLTKKIWPVEDKLNAECAYIGAKQAMMEMLATGTTCFADMYFFMDKVADAALETGIRCGLSRGIVDSENDSKLEDNLELARKYNNANGLVKVQLGPHAPYTVSFDMMKRIAAAAKKNNLSVQLHWLETQEEWVNSHLAGKITPEDYLVETGLCEVNQLLLAHCVWISEASMNFYKKENITIAHNPKSNLKLGSGIAPVAEYLKRGINVAIGTDGASSNNSLDMWEEMRFAALIQKGENCDPTLIKAHEAIKMVTVNGAKALDFDNTGLIKEGYTADMIVVDLNKPNYLGWDCENLAGYVVYSGSSKDVESTIIAGKTLYDNGAFTTIDKDEVLSEAVKTRHYLTEK